MTNNSEVSAPVSLFLRITNIAGWLLILAFFLSIVIAVLYCPPWSCYGENSIAYFLPFMAFFTIFPLGIVLISATKKSKGERNYGKNSLKRFENFLFSLGLLFIIAFLGIIGHLFMTCHSWECIRTVSMVSFFHVINLYTLLPFGILFMALSRKIRSRSVTEDKSGSTR